MSDRFDPYYKWLGIPPERQPPSHYELLGIREYESDPDVICSAADRQMTYLRTFQSGKNSKASQRLLNEVAAARICLVDAEKRAAYDVQLRSKNAAPTASPPKPAHPKKKAPRDNDLATEEPNQSAPQIEVATERPPTRQRVASEPATASRSKLVWPAVGAGVVFVVGIVVVLFVVLAKGDRAAGPSSNPPRPPLTLAAIANQNIAQGELLELRAQMTEPEHSHGDVSFSLDANGAKGATIDAETGQFRWRPDTGQAPKDYHFRIVAVFGDQTADTSFSVTVEAVHRPLTLDPIADRSVPAGSLVWSRLSAGNSAAPEQPLSFELVSGPEGAAVDPIQGDFVWRPDLADAGKSVSVKVCVRDGAGAAGEEKFIVCVDREKTFESVLQYVSADAHGLHGEWQQNDGEFSCIGSYAKLRVPVQINGDYDLRVRFTRHEGNDAVGVYLPVDPAAVVLFLSAWKGDVSGLDLIAGREMKDNETAVRPGQITSEQPHQIDVAVRHQSTLSLVDVRLDGQPYLRWRGPIGDLSVRREFQVPQRNEIALISHCPVTFHAVELRSIDGTYVLSDDAAKPGGSPAPVAEKLATDDAELEASVAQLMERLAAVSKESELHPLLFDAIKSLDDACRANRYDLAKKLALALRDAAKIPESKAWGDAILQLVAALQAELSDWVQVEPAFEVLKGEPGDAPANDAVGKWYGLHQGDWDKAVGYLANGLDAQLKPLAADDLTAASAGPDECVRRGDHWWSAAIVADNQRRDMMKLRAGWWYEKASTGGRTDRLTAAHENRLNEVARIRKRRACRFGHVWLQFPMDEDVRKELRSTFSDEFNDSRRFAQLALAAQIIQTAHETPEKQQQRVMLDEALRLAVSQGDPLLSMAALGRLEDLAGVALLGEKCAALSQAMANTRAVSMADAQFTVDACLEMLHQARDQAEFKQLLDVIDVAQRTISKSPQKEFVRSVELKREIAGAWLELFLKAETAATQLASPQGLPSTQRQAAYFDLAQLVGLCKRDWLAALPLLEDSNSSALAAPAEALAKSPDDAAAQQAMGDAWWKMSEAERRNPGYRYCLRTAALYWYEQALPKLDGLRRQVVQQRLSLGYADKLEGKASGLIVPLNGLAGMAYVKPEEVKGNVAWNGGQFALTDRAQVSFPTQPAIDFVHDFEITFRGAGGHLVMNYGDDEGVRLDAKWSDEKQKYVCLLQHYRPGTASWGGERQGNPGEKLHFTLYAVGGQYFLYQDDASGLRSSIPPINLRLTILTDPGTNVVFQRFEFRRLNSADAQRLRVSPPADQALQQQPAGELFEDAIRIYARNQRQADEPLLKRPGPFVVQTTETPMVWIEPGQFVRKYGSSSKPPTNVSVTNGFWIGRYEVTRGEWSRLSQGVPGGDDSSPLLPARNVDWIQALQFCAQLTQQEKRARRLPQNYEYRLPTEAEWELACRAGSAGSWSIDTNSFWHAGTSDGRLRNVGQSKPNPLGIYDMHGNVSEWCYDKYESEPSNPAAALTNPVAVPDDLDGPFVHRGGSWMMRADDCASDVRRSSVPIAQADVGFRIVVAPIAPRPQASKK